MPLVFWLFGIVAGLYALHRLALWMERKGWIYYRHDERPSGAGSMAVLQRMEVFKPELRHVIEEQVSGELKDVDDEIGELELPTE